MLPYYVVINSIFKKKLNNYDGKNTLLIIMLTNYVYLLQEREFIKTNEKIYKIGMTTKPNHTRFNQYPKGSTLLFQIICNDCLSIEKQILSNFKSTFILRKDIGNEYFEGNFTEMISIISAIVIESYKIQDVVEFVPDANNLNTKTKLSIPLENTDDINDNQMHYICEICNKAFSTKQNYNRHINNETIHTKIQDIDLYKYKYKYKCDCGKKYLHQPSLYKHKRRCNQNKTKTEPDLNQNIDLINDNLVNLVCN